LPAVPDESDVEPVLDGEIVEAPSRWVYRAEVIRVVGAAVHPHARQAGRHASYVAAGLIVLARRRRRRRTLAAEMAQLAAARGDHEQAAKWVQLDHQHREERAKRRREVWETTGNLLVLLPKIVKGAVIALAVFSVLMAFHGGVRGFEAPWRLVASIASFGYDAASLAWLVGPYAVPAAVLMWLWHVGRTAGDAPTWSIAVKPGEEDRGLVVTADGIVLALKHLPVAEMKKAFKDGWVPAFHTTPVRDGEGYFAVFSVPMGVTANDIADQVEVFARNLHRAKAEVWVTDAERAKVAPAGFVSLYVLNPGVLDRPTPEYPLMHDGQADVFEGVPGGVVARGDGELIPVTGKNMVVGGQMGEGKSNALRVFALGCCTDPLCEVEVFVFANNGDFDAFAPRLAAYFKGTDDDTAAAAANRLHELLEEVGRREGRLAELGAKKLTRRIAEQYPDMRPVVVLFSECHELFGHPGSGELAGELAVKIAKRARKTGIVLVFDTQSSRKSAIPPALVELMSVNACFYVKKWQSNDGFLGDGSFQAGIRATELRPGRDRGRSVITGISDSQFELLKWYFVEVNDDTGYDAATEVIARCMTTLTPGTRVSGGHGASLPAITARDLLADLDEVTGAERVKLRDAVGLLRKVDGMYPPYRRMTAQQLRDDLAAKGVKTVNTSGTLYLDPEQLRLVRAGRGE
jgi:S-DNA-T family DNA segregation ATPase FtsK/SpoIIIE